MLLEEDNLAIVSRHILCYLLHEVPSGGLKKSKGKVIANPFLGAYLTPNLFYICL